MYEDASPMMYVIIHFLAYLERFVHNTSSDSSLIGMYIAQLIDVDWLLYMVTSVVTLDVTLDVTSVVASSVASAGISAVISAVTSGCDVSGDVS